VEVTMGEIYIAENKINGMVYIGKTTKNIDRRRWDHVTKALRKTNNLRFHNAIRNYGPENFEWQILDVCNNSDLDEQEIYYIKLYKSYNKEFGYNMTEGGDNDPKCNLGRKFSEEHKKNMSIALLGRKFSEDTLENMSKAQRRRYKHDEKLRDILKNNDVLKKKTLQYDLKGNFVRCWESIRSASDILGVDDSNISRACNREWKTSAGFIWRYENDNVTKEDLYDINKSKKLSQEHKDRITASQRKTIIQYDLLGNFIKIWNGVDIASKETGIAKSGIIRCCQGKYKKSGEFIWKYKKDVGEEYNETRL
jgi:group I intron endonuclease